MKQSIPFYMVFALIASLLIACSGKSDVSYKTEETGANRNFLSLSDIHFNPYYDTTLLKQLIANPANKWESIFETSKVTGFGYYGWQTDWTKIDTNWNLFKSSLDEIVAVNPNPDFITINGDFLGHEFEQVFVKYYKSDEVAMRDFITKTIDFVSSQIEKRFPGTPIFPTLGNNDAFCGDYEIRDSGSFLSRTAPIFARNLKGLIDTQEFNESYKKGGYYIAENPNNPRHKVISLNTVMMSGKYLDAKNNVCQSLPSKSVIDGYVQDMFAWLDKNLSEAKSNGDKVWLMYHIPPGINAYSSIDATPAYYYQEQYNQQYLAMVDKYSDVIIAQLGGHTHMDNFIVINGSTTPNSFVHISPAITPVYENNPGFLEYTYTPSSGELIDYNVHGFDDVQASTKPNWSKEYTFSTTYNQDKLSPANLKSVYTSFTTDAAAKKHYIDYYVVEDTAQTIKEADWNYYYCAFGNQTAETYSSCLARLGQ
ncbi:metallophosphoesterase [Roseivirga sp. E12]|uniref:metallophosphoesterase n=1 Tax=Roseivirga sp. E12 TaxID=2819237 RepID=UPI001ABC1FB6|nr:metallophosphoesterase [Roseivirga sp. E12]MBO3697283.1 metallophosphoesterase [Roseivirga sp. E12]